MTTRFDPKGPIAELDRLGIARPAWATTERRDVQDGIPSWTYANRFVAPDGGIALATLIAQGWRLFVGTAESRSGRASVIFRFRNGGE
ncbi:hypothetical protein [Microbacterium sp. E-13]|uniref:hypothetical protein n=1 Tax=Microbacterium sp. E-13 TaxID=3404048 RepID=UPI003CEA0396